MIGPSFSTVQQFLSVLDTGAGSSFVPKSVLSEALLQIIKLLSDEIRVRDTNNNRIEILGSIELAVSIGSRQQMGSFYVIERLATNFKLSSNFCDKHVEAIQPRQRTVELDEGTTVPISDKSGRYNFAATVPSEE